MNKRANWRRIGHSLLRTFWGRVVLGLSAWAIVTVILARDGHNMAAVYVTVASYGAAISALSFYSGDAQARRHKFRILKWGMGIGAPAFLSAVLLTQAYEWADSAGWISHQIETSVAPRADWFDGQSKECESFPLGAKAAAALQKDAGYAVDGLSCDDGPQRQMRVTFWGRLNQPDYGIVN